MRVISKSTIVEFNEAVEPRDTDIDRVNYTNYKIERLENDDEVIWYGRKRDWRYSKKDERWFIMVMDQVGRHSEECEPPMYEKVYQETLHPFELIYKE
jgi:hypothetical protein